MSASSYVGVVSYYVRACCDGSSVWTGPGLMMCVVDLAMLVVGLVDRC